MSIKSFSKELEESSDGYLFDIEDIVWARVKGFPWWPSIIADVRKNATYLLNFIGHNSHAYLTEDKLKFFDPNNSDKYLLKRGGKAQKEAFNAAIRINKGNKSFQEEANQIIIAEKEKEDAISNEILKNAYSN